MNDVLVCKISPLFIYPKQLKATYHTGCPILSGHFIQTESMSAYSMHMVFEIHTVFVYG